MPNEPRRGAVALALLLPLAMGHVPPGYADPASQPDTGKTGEPVSGTEDASAGKESAEGGGESSGPEPFVPSEKISADSAVSFPVDI